MSDIEELSEKTLSQSEETIVNDKLTEILLNIQEQRKTMEHLIKSQIEVKDDLIDRLHKELEYYKQDAAERFVEQVMKSIIKVRKDMSKMMSSNQWSTMTVQDLQREYTYIFEDLTDLLEQQNIDSYCTEPGNDFDASIHQPKLEITTDPMLDKKVKESLGEGYKKKGRVLQPERVIVYQYKA